MADNENIPSKDPADEGNLAGVLKSILRKFSQGLDVQLPARVIAYDRATNLATVQPLIAMLTTDGATVSRAEVARVPVLALGGGGFVVNFPLKPGDMGWIEASDRDISLFVQAHKQVKPNTLRMHTFSDSRFIPDVFDKYTFSDELGPEGMTIQSLDGSQRIVIHDGGVHIKCTSLVADVETALITASGDVSVISGTVITLQAPLTAVAGNMTVSGGIGVGGAAPGAPGTMTAQELQLTVGLTTPSAIIAGIEHATHRHPDGSPNTGTPIA